MAFSNYRSLLFLLYRPFFGWQLLAYLSGFAILLGIDSLSSMFLASHIGGFAAIGYGGALSILGGVLFVTKAEALRRRIIDEGRKGISSPRTLYQYGGVLVLLVPMMFPGIFSSALALVFYLPPLCRWVGRHVLGLRGSDVAEIQQHISH